jgi:hypothetical protein
VVDKVALFHRVLRFPLPILIPLTAPQSTIVRGWYNGPISGRRTKWTQSHPTPPHKIKRNKLWEELIAYFPLIRHGPHWIWLLKQYFIVAGTSPSNDRGIHRTTDTRPKIRLLRVFFFATETCLSSRCLAIKEGIHFTESLPSNGRRHTHTHRLIGGRDLWSTSLRYSLVPRHTKFYIDWFRHSEFYGRGGGLFTDTQESMEIA